MSTTSLSLCGFEKIGFRLVQKFKTIAETILFTHFGTQHTIDQKKTHTLAVCKSFIIIFVRPVNWKLKVEPFKVLSESFCWGNSLNYQICTVNFSN